MKVLGSFLWESGGFVAWYTRHSWTVDAVLYLVFFLGVARVTVGRQFEDASGRGASAISAAVGTALAISAIMLSRRTGFSLADLGPMAWSILLLVIGLTVYGLIRSMVGSRSLAVGATLVFLSAAVVVSGPSLPEFFDRIGLGAIPALIGTLGLLSSIGWLLLHGVHAVPRRATPFDREPLNASTREPGEPPRSKSGERSVANLIGILCEHLSEQRIDDHSKQVLDDLARTNRVIESLYEDTVRELARRGWRSESGKDSLDDGVKQTLLACRRNITEYRETLRIAQAGHEAGNRRIVLEAIDRLVRIERDGHRLCQILTKMLSRLASSPGDDR